MLFAAKFHKTSLFINVMIRKEGVEEQVGGVCG